MKTCVEVQVRLVIETPDVDGEVDVGEVIDDMDYDFTSNTDNAKIVDTLILDYQVKSVPSANL